MKHIFVLMKFVMPVSLSPDSLSETASHSTRLPKTAAKSLVIPQSGREGRSLAAQGRI